VAIFVDIVHLWCFILLCRWVLLAVLACLVVVGLWRCFWGFGSLVFGFVGLGGYVFFVGGFLLFFFVVFLWCVFFVWLLWAGGVGVVEFWFFFWVVFVCC